MYICRDIRLKKLECMENISMTASTGMARLQFVNGQTIHSWSGYGNGHTDLNTLTAVQESHNNILLAASCLTSFQMFLNEQNNYLKGLVSLYRIHPQRTKCNWCAMVSHLDTYLKSTAYKDQCTKALQLTELTPIHN